MELLAEPLRPHRNPVLTPESEKSSGGKPPNQVRIVGDFNHGRKTASCLPPSGKMGHTPEKGGGCPWTERGREGGQNQTNPECTGEADNVTTISQQGHDRAGVQAGGADGSCACYAGKRTGNKITPFLLQYLGLDLGSALFEGH